MSKRKRDDSAPAVSELDVGIVTFRSAALPQHPTGIFQSRWADFHVREISSDGHPLELTELPTAAPPRAEIISFVMYKENRTTADAIQQVASAAGAPPYLFSVAGSKDRRAVTVQEVTASGLREPSRLLRVNEKGGGSRVRVGHFRAADRRLGLADSHGNRFVVVLRQLKLVERAEGAADSPEASEARLREGCERAADALRASGFVNYFGLQRFGNDGALPTHAVGAALLKRELVRALKCVLSPRQAGLKPAGQRALEAFEISTDAREALRRLPPRGFAREHKLLSAYVKRRGAGGATPTGGQGGGQGGEQGSGEGGGQGSGEGSGEGSEQDEAAALAALQQLPRRQLLLYVNALQALAFNRAASCRLTTLDSTRAVEGDLVWRDGGDGNDAGSDEHASARQKQQQAEEDTGAVDPDAAAADGEATGAAATTATAAAAFTRAPLPPPVRALSSDEAASGRYSLSDVLLPLPGHSVEYPRHAAGLEYGRVLSSLGLADSGEGGEGGDGSGSGLWYEPGLFDLPGGYRPLLAHPTNLSSELVPYTDHTKTLEPTDLDKLEAAAARPAASAPAADPPSAASQQPQWAWRLAFSLPASVYATMLLREVLHEPLDADEHARRSKAALAGGLAAPTGTARPAKHQQLTK